MVLLDYCTWQGGRCGQRFGPHSHGLPEGGGLVFLFQCLLVILIVCLVLFLI